MKRWRGEGSAVLRIGNKGVRGLLVVSATTLGKGGGEAAGFSVRAVIYSLRGPERASLARVSARRLPKDGADNGALKGRSARLWPNTRFRKLRVDHAAGAARSNDCHLASPPPPSPPPPLIECYLTAIGGRD